MKNTFSLDLLDREDPEIVIGLVAPVGTEKQIIIDQLRDSLKSFGYRSIPIKLSSALQAVKDKHGIDLVESPEDARISSYMDAGNRVREQTKRGEALALWAVNDIAFKRAELEATAKKRAYVLDSLKHPDEVQLLRKIYGPGFYLVGVYSPRDKRFDFLHTSKGISEVSANNLIERDHHEDIPGGFGQDTRETFHLADLFVSLTNPAEARNQVTRFIDLIFGYPFATPTLQEYAMFHAFAARLRSADLSRQVGAVIVAKDEEIIGMGANDVPKAGGGLYWPGVNDHRDHDWGYDSNAKRRDQILMDIVQLVKKKSNVTTPSDDDLLLDIKEGLAQSMVLDITEFGRPVHAEMEAILSCARSGVSPRGGTLYCTTFPCHNCAKHIVAAGIKKVVYVEPYPKSKAGELHRDSIQIDNETDRNKVSFVPFAGIGSRRFIDLFSMGVNSGYAITRKDKRTNNVIAWKRNAARIRIPLLVTSYLKREIAAQKAIRDFYFKGEEREQQRDVRQEKRGRRN